MSLVRGTAPAAGLALLLTAPVAGATGDLLPGTVRWVMGTSLEITIRHEDAEVAARARDAAFGEAQRLDNLLSAWLDYSPLSRLNAAAGNGPVRTDPELVLYLERARLDTERTHGVFDVTVGALAKLHRAGPPGEDALARALAVTGMNLVSVTLPDLVEMPAGLALDSGGDGKGIAVDAIVRILRERGITSALVDFGHSTVYGLGDDNGSPWIYGLSDAAGALVGAVELRDSALSLSASLVSDEPGEKLRGHIVDPRSGHLVTARRHAAALSRWATDAEVLSTTLVVTGRAGRFLLGRFDSADAAVFDDETPPWMTEGFAEVFTATGTGAADEAAGAARAD